MATVELGEETMNEKKRERLKTAGWQPGSAGDFLGLSDEESAYIEVKLSLSNKLRDSRIKAGISQAELAKRLKSSQSRVAKMEAGDPSVSVDLLIRSLLATGTTRKQVAQAIAGPRQASRDAA